ncbi:MarR family winged helix-turn-helix transcriptional regulator [Parapusillimonas granuli]|uniref:Winged helix-turn-helix transcriptional regulator n=1 Tax=Parapusillimonas granuli TaxID=380911 RepID=A0A853FZP4_9BURK|nr:helix-turn-helix domain-containing protein [Parapusillimonas granuli]MBB5215212.1 DNA-binding MarR family transcriptional regulator [Parapusillimonas granuli]MEB2401800.1 helix-turn-helix domain-containing protein [Alcaligenaceae bacterium]NYT49529.1 winged helix-turn-helix transcriptional regulator [Parapusillimonas granuli]
MTSYNNPSKSPDGNPTPADYRALATFRLALRRFSAFSEDAAMKAGLMPQQHQALLAIKAMSVDGQAPSVGDVAAQLLIRHHSAVELINRLVRMELVQRYRDPADRRRVRIALTALAERKLATLSTAHLNELRAVRPELAKLLRYFEP